MSTTITVTSAAELNQALSQATGGETILLAAGNYGKLDLNGIQFASNVTIQSADPNAMASFSSVKINQSSNITFDTIDFDYNHSSGDYLFQSPFTVNASSSIAFHNSVFDGDIVSGAGTGMGLKITHSNNVDVVNTEFKSWFKGVFATNSDGVSVTDSDIHSIRSDGLVFDNVDNITVERNYLHDFGAATGANDHRDMIQVQRANGSGSDNIIIRDNVFDMGNGDNTQTIWMGGDGKDVNDPNVMHHNVLIEGNTIYNGHYHGISLYGIDGLTITQNSVLHVDVPSLTGGIEIPVIHVSTGSKNVTIEQNIASDIRGYHGQSDWTVSNNALIQPGEYSQHFTYQATAQADGYNHWVTIPGSLADSLNAGSSLTSGTTQPSSGTTQPDSGTTQPDSGTTQPDSGTTDPDAGNTTPDTSDGTSTENPTLPGDSALADQLGNISDTELAQRSSSNDTGGEMQVDISNQDSRGNIGTLDSISDSEQVYLSVDVTRDGDTGGERLVWNHSNFGLKVTNKGHLVVKVDNNDGGFHNGFKIKNAGLNDGQTHEVTLMVDQDADQLQVLIDGNVVLDETDTDFDFVGGRERDWYVGDSVDTFAIDDEAPFIDQSADHYSDLFA